MMAAGVLVGIGSDAAAAAMPTLMELLQEGGDYRDSAIVSLGEAGELAAPAIPHLIEALDGEYQTPVHAARALAKIGAKNAVPALLELVHRGKVFQKLAAAEAIATLDPEEAKKMVPTLASEARKEDHRYDRDKIRELVKKIDPASAAAHGLA
jgi:HEAT repeat protein